MSSFDFVLVGGLLTLVALSRPLFSRFAPTTTMLYLVIGWALSPQALGYLPLDPASDSRLLEKVTELAVLVSLFVCGLKMQVHFTDPLWRLPLRLAFLSMTLTVAGIALIGHFALGMPLGLAVLLGAVLAPTDPVLASEVQVEGAHDRDQVRFALTGEAGFNDGSAFPFVYLGLALLGLHDVGAWGWSWVVIDVLWGIGGALLIGSVLGALAGVAVRRWISDNERLGVHEFLALGLVFVSYGVAIALHTHGFLAAFAVGIAVRWTETRGNVESAESAVSGEILGFKERLERLFEAVTVIFLGSVAATVPWSWSLAWFVPLLFLVVRPLSVLLGCLGAGVSQCRRLYLCWFGVRGIGSVYYLAYAAQKGLPGPYTEQIAELVYPVLALSILFHGFSVAPLMARYTESTQA